jgi:hypothetical protein
MGRPPAPLVLSAPETIHLARRIERLRLSNSQQVARSGALLERCQDTCDIIAAARSRLSSPSAS